MAYRYNAQTGMFEEVEDFPHIDSFTFEGKPIRYKGETVVFNWNVQDAQRIFINGIEVPASSSSYSYRLSSAGLKDFVLRAENGGDNVTGTIQIKVVERPVFHISKSTDRLRKGKGESCTIKWCITNAMSVRLIGDGIDENVPLVSERNFSPEDSASYRFEAIGLDDKKVFSNTACVEVLEESRVSFTVDKNMTLPHVPVRLSWDVENASAVELAGRGRVAHKGEMIADCDRDTVFVLKVTDAFGTAEYRQEVRMYPLPLIRSILVPAPEIERNVSIETNFDFKHIQVGINASMAEIPDFVGIRTRIWVPLREGNELSVPQDTSLRHRIGRYLRSLRNFSGFPEFHPDCCSRTMPGKGWWRTLEECRNKLIERIKDKISDLWNR